MCRFPLYLKGVERALFHYAVHLLNKNIAQVSVYVCVCVCVCVWEFPLLECARVCVCVCVFTDSTTLWIWNVKSNVEKNSAQPQIYFRENHLRAVSSTLVM